MNIDLQSTRDAWGWSEPVTASNAEAKAEAIRSSLSQIPGVDRVEIIFVG